MPNRLRLTYLRSDHVRQPPRPERACRSDPRVVPTCAPHTLPLLQAHSYTYGQVLPLFHKDIPALPFTRLRLSAIKPTRYTFRGEATTLGDHLRKRRLTLQLIQRDVAATLGVTVETLVNWELNRTKPKASYVPVIIRFLEHDLRQVPRRLISQLEYYRDGLGLTQNTFAKKLGVDESTLSGWIAGRHAPSPTSLRKLKKVLPTVSFELTSGSPQCAR